MTPKHAHVSIALLITLLCHSSYGQSWNAVAGVVSGRDTIGIKNARILLVGEAIIDDALYNPQTRLLGSATSSEDGRFSLQLPSTSNFAIRKYTLVCLADGYALQTRAIVSTDELSEIQFQMSSITRTIEGSVLGEDGSSVANAVISVRFIRTGIPEGQRYIRFDSVASDAIRVTTDLSGHFVINDLPADTVWVGVQVVTGDFAAYSHAISVQDSRNTKEQVVLKLSREARYHIHGRLTESSRTLSCSNAKLQLVSYQKGSPVGEIAIVTDSEGRFDSWAFEGESITLAVISPTGSVFRLLSKKLAIELDGSPLSFQMPELVASVDATKRRCESLQVEFRLFEPSGKPVNSGFMLNSRGETFAVIDGHCSYTDMLRGEKFRVYAFSSDGKLGATESFNIDGAKNLEFNLVPTSSIQLKILGEDDKPLKNAPIFHNSSLHMQLDLSIESGNAICPELGLDEKVHNVVPLVALNEQTSKLTTNDEGVVRFDGLCPGAKYVFSHVERMRIGADGHPIYAGNEVADCVYVDGRSTCIRPIRVGFDSTTELTLSTQQWFEGSRNTERAFFGSTEWKLDKLPGFEKAASEFPVLRNQLSEIMVDIEVPTVGGSGTIVDSNGLVLTCAHLFKSTKDDVLIRTSAGVEYKAELLGSCPDLDLAMLKVDRPFAAKIQAAERSHEKPHSGQWCIIAGYPGKSRIPIFRLAKVLHNDDVRLVCTGPLLGGDSGGAVFDLHGRLMGVNTGGANVSESYHTEISQVNQNFDRLRQGDFWRVLVD